VGEVKHVLDPGLAARLPPEMRRLLETRVPNGPTWGYNLAVQAGLRFALRLLSAAPCTIEQVREALAEAVKVMEVRLAEQEKEELPKIYAKHRQELTVDQLVEYLNFDPNEKGVPLEDIIREFEALQAEEERDLRNGTSG
jgi:hypothetical protein